MSPHTLSYRVCKRTSPLLQMRLWHLGVLVALVAVAIADILDYGRTEPALISLAVAGYTGYVLICWVSWHRLRRFQSRMVSVLLVAVYAVAMAGLFLAATVAYLIIEFFYLGGKLF